MDNSKNKKNPRFRKSLLYLTLLLVALLEIFLPHDPYFWFDGLPGFYTAFGLVACLLTIIICKALGRHWLKVREDYYDEIPLNPPLTKGDEIPLSPPLTKGDEIPLSPPLTKGDEIPLNPPLTKGEIPLSPPFVKGDEGGFGREHLD
jgi:hypothetical protein